MNDQWPDDYEHLGPAMKHRLDTAELVVAKLHDWIALKAEAGAEHWRLMAELCLIMGWARPKRGE